MTEQVWLAIIFVSSAVIRSLAGLVKFSINEEDLCS